MPVRLQQHLERKRHVQQPDPAAGVERVDAGSSGRALLQQRSGRRMLHAAGRMVGDLLGSLRQGRRAQRQEVRGHQVIVDLRRRPLAEPIRDDLPQPHIAGVSVKPEQVQEVAVK